MQVLMPAPPPASTALFQCWHASEKQSEVSFHYAQQHNPRLCNSLLKKPPSGVSLELTSAPPSSSNVDRLPHTGRFTHRVATKKKKILVPSRSLAFVIVKISHEHLHEILLFFFFLFFFTYGATHAGHATCAASAREQISAISKTTIIKSHRINS